MSIKNLFLRYLLLAILLNVQGKSFSQETTHYTLQELINYFSGDPVTSLNEEWITSEKTQLGKTEQSLAAILINIEGGEAREKIEFYESFLETIAQQVRTKLNDSVNPHQIIAAINKVLFEEIGFRYPPLSNFTQDTDKYSFLSSVLKLRRGICLGTSCLYLCIAEKLNLRLEIVCPPGHIFLRYVDENNVETNIETTVRGIHIPTQSYLTENVFALETYEYSDLPAFLLHNQAATYLTKKEYTEAIKCYIAAIEISPNILFSQNLLCAALILNNQKEEAQKIFQKIQSSKQVQTAIFEESIFAEYFKGEADEKCLALLFEEVDDSRESLEGYVGLLQERLKKYPNWRSGWLQLASANAQLSYISKAIDALLQAEKIHDKDPSALFFLSYLHYVESHFKQSWLYLQKLEKILKQNNYSPKNVRDLRSALLQSAPHLMNSYKQ